MKSCKRILLKITGKLFLSPDTHELDATLVNQVIAQIKQLSSTHLFGIVVGGGNFFRGSQHGKRLGMNPSVGHQVGMLATMMNGLILKDLLEKQGLKTALLCAMPSPEVGSPISQQDIATALKEGSTIIFTGGTGNPYFTTDTNAVLRGLQIEADEIWKGTSVDGIYDSDPLINPQAQLLKTVSYSQAINQNLAIMDATAYTLAQQHNQRIRIFNIFEPNALINAAQNPEFGSTIQKG